MNIYEPISKNFLEGKKIDISFSRSLNKKEKDFFRYLFINYKLLETLEKTTVINEIPLKDIMSELKYSSIVKLQKFLNNLQGKKLIFSIYDKKKLLLSGSFPVFSSYNIIYNKLDFIFPREMFFARKKDTLFSLLRFDFLLFMGDEASYNLYAYLISFRSHYNSVEVPLDEVREILEAGEKYERFFDFEKKLLKKAVDDINLFSDIKLEYDKIKIGEYRNNKVEKIKFCFNSKNEADESIKNINFANSINFIMELLKGDIQNFHIIYELIKNYIIRRDFDYVYKNVLFAKENFKTNIERNLKKSLLLDLACASKMKRATEIINLRKHYSTPFYIQLDISTLLRKYDLLKELQILLDTGFFNKVTILKDDQILNREFDTFRIYIHYFKNRESSLRISIVE